MRKLVTFCLLIAALNAAMAPHCYAAETESFRPAITELGTYTSPRATCQASLSISTTEGGFNILSIDLKDRLVPIADDVTAIVWLDTSQLAYSVSPIYGRPGLYVVDCKSAKSRRLLGPTTKTPAYPDGTDFFELKSVTLKPIPTLAYYYGADVDRIDFREFRTKKNVRLLDVAQPSACVKHSFQADLWQEVL